MNNFVLKKILKDISKETGISVEEVEDVVLSQFKFIRDTISSGNPDEPESFKNINVAYLGKFVIRDYKVKELNEKRKRRDSGE